jgi:metallo-beta-lactamase class B
MKLQIAGFVPNHWHEDCIGGLNYLKSQKINSYANQLTIDIAKNKGLPVPDQGFKDSLRLSLGDKFIYCYFFGAAHSLDNIVVWIPSEEILFPGCMCKSLNSGNPGNVSDGDISEYPKTIDKVIQKFKSAKVVIPGHGPIGGPELLTHTKSLTTQY